MDNHPSDPTRPPIAPDRLKLTWTLRDVLMVVATLVVLAMLAVTFWGQIMSFFEGGQPSLGSGASAESGAGGN